MKYMVRATVYCEVDAPDYPKAAIRVAKRLSRTVLAVSYITEVPSSTQLIKAIKSNAPNMPEQVERAFPLLRETPTAGWRQARKLWQRWCAKHLLRAAQQSSGD